MARKKKSAEQEAKMDMTPMIDVTFQLLIFFIITMKFKTLEKKLKSYLPTDFGLSSSSEPVEEIFVEVRLQQDKNSTKPIRERETRFYINGNQEITGTQKEIYAKILKNISGFRQDQKEAKGKIHAGIGVPHNKVVAVLDMFHGARYETITFVGLAPNKDVVQGDNLFRKLQKKLGDVK